MTGKKKRRKRRRGYRQYEHAAPRELVRKSRGPEPRGLGRLFGLGAPPGTSEMPSFRTSIGQGFLLVGSSPILVLVPFAFVLLAWVALLAFGFIGSPSTLGQSFALPPISIGYDTQNTVILFGQQTGQIVALVFLVLRALIVSLTAGLVVEAFEEAGSVSMIGVIRGIRAMPVVLASVILGFVGLLLSQFAFVLGPGIGLLVEVLVPAGILYLLGFVPFAAVRHGWRLSDTLRRSVAAARNPGGRQFSFCLLYLLLVFFLPLAVPGRTQATANPGVSSWISILLLTFIHMGFTAAMAYRWLALDSSVEEVSASPP